MRNKYRQILFYLSVFIILIGALQLTPLLGLVFYPEEAKWAYCFLIPGLGAIAVGALLYFRYHHIRSEKLDNDHVSILVVLAWVCAIVISTFPWMLSGKYNFSQAIFETTSGYSTTGLTVVDVENCPHIFLLFRSVALLVGGVGLVLILSSALSDRYGLNIYNAEGHTDRILPNLARSARVIISIYLLYIVLGTLAYYLAGMPLFDSINTSIAALSTGGFSVRNESIYAYHSLAIEIITIVLMMLGGTNFVIHYSFFHGKLKTATHNCETRFLLLLIFIFIPYMTILLKVNEFEPNLWEALRISAFQFVSCITTTGFVSIPSLNYLPSAFAFIMILMMLVGGNMESTAGGIKQYRVIVTLKGIYYMLKDTISSRKVIRTRFIERLGTRKVLEDDEVRSMTSYVLFYILLFFLGSFIFCSFGYSIQDSMLEFSSALSTVGLSVGITGYNAHPIILWTGTIGMFLGRMEIMIVFQTILRVGKDFKEKRVTGH